MDGERWNVLNTDGDRFPAVPSSNPERTKRELDRISGAASPKQMSIPLGQLVKLLLRAEENDHTWLRDFADDIVMIDADLHEVLIAFQNLPPGRAA